MPVYAMLFANSYIFSDKHHVHDNRRFIKTQSISLYFKVFLFCAAFCKITWEHAHRLSSNFCKWSMLANWEDTYYYIPEIWNFGDIMVLVWTPPHAKACVSRNCDTNDHQCAYQIHIWHSHWWPRVEEPYRYLWKYDEKACALHNLIKNAFQFL